MPCEITPGAYTTGAVGMAQAGDASGGSQLFITHSPQPHLDGRYTLFARLRRGQAVVDSLLPGDRILKVTLSP